MKKFKVIMSSGEPIEIEADEVGKVIAAAQSRSIAVCRRGVINPAHMVSIVPAPNPYAGSNIPKSEQSPEQPLSDAFLDLRTSINQLAASKHARQFA